MNDQLIRVLHQDSSSCITVAGSFVNTKGRRSHLKSGGSMPRGTFCAIYMVFDDNFGKISHVLFTRLLQGVQRK